MPGAKGGGGDVLVVLNGTGFGQVRGGGGGGGGDGGDDDGGGGDGGDGGDGSG